MADKRVGAPSKYRRKYCAELIDFFENAEPNYELPVEVQDKHGDVTTKMTRVANPPPFLTKFARNIGVSRETLYEWGRVHPEFSDALKRAKEIMEEFLIENTLNGNYAQSFAIFMAKNTIHWTDKTEQKHTHEFPESIKIEFVKPNK